jgi:hypothetical protein
MRIIDLIDGLQKLRDSYTQEHLDIFGEPTVYLDTFEAIKDEPGKFTYAGINYQVKIEKSDDGVYDIISSFAESYPNEHTTAKLSPDG